MYNYKKLAALVADEEAYCEVEYHAGRKTFAAGSKSTGFYEQRTEADIVEEMREEKGGSIGKRSTASSGWRGL